MAGSDFRTANSFRVESLRFWDEKFEGNSRISLRDRGEPKFLGLRYSPF